MRPLLFPFLFFAALSAYSQNAQDLDFRYSVSGKKLSLTIENKTGNDILIRDVYYGAFKELPCSGDSVTVSISILADLRTGKNMETGTPETIRNTGSNSRKYKLADGCKPKKVTVVLIDNSPGPYQMVQAGLPPQSLIK